MQLGTGLLKTVSKAKSSTALKMTIRWGFILSIVLGVMANLNYLIIASNNREVRVAGTVRDEAENSISFAVVDLGGKKGRAITDAADTPFVKDVMQCGNQLLRCGADWTSH